MRFGGVRQLTLVLDDTSIVIAQRHQKQDTRDILKTRCPFASLGSLTTDIKQSDNHVAHVEARFSNTCRVAAYAQNVVLRGLIARLEDTVNVGVKVWEILLPVH